MVLKPYIQRIPEAVTHRGHARMMTARERREGAGGREREREREERARACTDLCDESPELGWRHANIGIPDRPH